MVGVEDHRAVLDCFAGVCVVCVDHVEAQVKPYHEGHEGPRRNARPKYILIGTHLIALRSFRGTMTKALMDVQGKRVLVVGLGKSGVASSLFLQSRGARVTVSDEKSQEQLRNEIPALLDKGIVVETGKHGERTFRDQDLIVVSPGVPNGVPQLVNARKMGIPVI